MPLFFITLCTRLLVYLAYVHYKHLKKTHMIKKWLGSLILHLLLFFPVLKCTKVKHIINNSKAIILWANYTGPIPFNVSLVFIRAAFPESYLYCKIIYAIVQYFIVLVESAQKSYKIALNEYVWVDYTVNRGIWRMLGLPCSNLKVYCARILLQWYFLYYN